MENGDCRHSYWFAILNALETAVHVAASKIDVGFLTKATLAQTLREKKLSHLQVFKFRKECDTLLADIVTKV